MYNSRPVPIPRLLFSVLLYSDSIVITVAPSSHVTFPTCCYSYED